MCESEFFRIIEQISETRSFIRACRFAEQERSESTRLLQFRGGISVPVANLVMSTLYWGYIKVILGL